MSKLIYDRPTATIVGRHHIFIQPGPNEVEPAVAADVVEHTEAVLVSRQVPDPDHPEDATKTITVTELVREPRGVEGLRAAPGETLPPCPHCSKAEASNGVPAFLAAQAAAAARPAKRTTPAAAAAEPTSPADGRKEG